MAELYFTLVINQKRTCDVTNKDVKKVPSSYIDIVRAMLEERGYDENGYNK